MKLAPLALALTLVTAASAQTFTDPANLRGERVSPRDGRELPVDQGAKGLEQLLRKLNTRASLMNIVAHPDDEDGGMLTLYSRGLGARVADLSLNRGEGGQNAMTADFEDALGLLRTQELLACDRYSGVDQFFGTEVDFGFSKTKSEAFTKWGHDRVLYDVVRAIRIYRPLVLTSTWVGGVTDGHGQHQVSGQIAQEAFVAAGDPKVFPELTKEGILPWQPLKIYARVPMQSISAKGLFDYATGQYVPASFTNYVTGETTTTPPTVDVLVHEGTPDKLLDGKTYVQFARLGLGQQKSQIGPGFRNAPAGAYDVSYHLYGSCLKSSSSSSVCHPSQSGGSASFSTAPENSTADPNFFTGIDTSLEGIADLAPHAPPSLRAALHEMEKSLVIANQASQTNDMPGAAHALYQFFNPLSEILATLDSPEAEGDSGDRLSGTGQWIALPKGEREALRHELRIKWQQADEALINALNIHVAASIPGSRGYLSTNHDASIEVEVTTSSTEAKSYGLELAKVHLAGATAASLPVPQPETSLTNTSPFHGTLNLSSSLLRSLPITRPYFLRTSIEQAVYDIAQPELRNAAQTPLPLVLEVVLFYRLHPFALQYVVQGDGQPISIVPPVSLSLSSHAQVIPNIEQNTRVATFLYPTATPAISPKLKVPVGWKITPAINDTDAPGEMSWQINAPSINRTGFVLHASTDFGEQQITEGYRPVGYSDLPRTNFYAPATTRIVPVDLKLPAKKNIAYLPGTGDDIPEVLTSLNITPTILKVSDLTSANLTQYDTIILGVRTYNAHPELHGAPTKALLDYARNGGNVVVQFQTPEFTADDAPYPLSLGSNEKVVDETAPVTLLTPANRGVEASFSSPSGSGKKGALAPGSLTNPLLTTPNALTPADFNNWIAERGHGFLSTWDAHYTALLEVHDPGVPAEHVEPQEPQRGGLITVQLGKGRWTYCAFALYRQLPEAVPGAFRLFANLINP